MGTKNKTKKAGAKKSSVKKTMAKKSSVKKTMAKKSAVKKIGAKKSAKKIGAKKSSVKKTMAKKSSVKKTMAKKSSVKKTMAKKAAEKKAMAKKIMAKKAAEKKAMAKKIMAKKAAEKKAMAKKIMAKKAAEKKAMAKKAAEKKAAAKKSEPAKIKFPVKLALREKELEDILAKEEESKRILRDMQGRNYCLVESCDFPSIVEGYCRLHYIAGWKVILQRKKILEKNYLENFMFRLVEKYTSSILEYMIKDLNSEKSFNSVVKKLEDDGDFDIEDENLLSLLEE